MQKVSRKGLARRRREWPTVSLSNGEHWIVSSIRLLGGFVLTLAETKSNIPIVK